MKTTELKKLIKEAVREAIQEEIKDILLEAVRSPKPTISAGAPVAPVVENTTTQKTIAEQRAAYASIMGDMKMSGGNMNLTSADVNTFQPRPVDSANGSLPEGNVGLDQIMGLMKK